MSYTGWAFWTALAGAVNVAATMKAAHLRHHKTAVAFGALTVVCLSVLVLSLLMAIFYPGAEPPVR